MIHDFILYEHVWHGRFRTVLYSMKLDAYTGRLNFCIKENARVKFIGCVAAYTSISVLKSYLPYIHLLILSLLV